MKSLIFLLLFSPVLAQAQTLVTGQEIFSNYAVWIDSVASGPDGGSAIDEKWSPRALDTEVFDTGDFGSITGATVTLNAGTYFCEFSQNFYNTYQTHTRLVNTTSTKYALG